MQHECSWKKSRWMDNAMNMNVGQWSWKKLNCHEISQAYSSVVWFGLAAGLLLSLCCYFRVCVSA